MPRKLPSLELIRGFEAAARHLSFTKAAEELFVTQSAVSRQAKALEEDLGVPLFSRHNRAIRLTEAGEALYRASAQALATLGEAVSQIRAQEQLRVVTVSCTFGFASLWLVPRLAGLRERHPGIDLRISADNRFVDLDRERIELAIRYCAPQLAPPGAVKLFDEEVFPVCSPRLRRRSGRPLASPADLRDHVLLVLDDPQGLRPTSSWPLWLEVARLGEVKPAGTLHFSHYDQLIQAAVDGQGIALGSSALVRGLMQQRKLVAPFRQSFPSPRAYFLVVADAARERADVRAVVEWLLREAGGDRAREGARSRRQAASRKRRPAP
jgi:DNA-binding transcriptional LysR family regulator